MRVLLRNGAWRVPSQSFVGTYSVSGSGPAFSCTCPDFGERQLPCKHIFAVQFTLFRETTTTPDGATVETTTTTTRVTYDQDWPAYNAAQTTEKATFLRLLHALCAA